MSRYRKTMRARRREFYLICRLQFLKENMHHLKLKQQHNFEYS